MENNNINNNIIIGIACDHAGYDLKKYILNNLKLEFVDYGCDSSEISCDYPVFAKKLCENLVSDKIQLGILICGTGIGMSIVANKFHQKIRAGLCSDIFTAKMLKAHNNCNVLCLGSRVLESSELAIEIIKQWLNTEFEAGRHERRIKMLEN